MSRWGIFILDLFPPSCPQETPQQAFPLHLLQNSVTEWRWCVWPSAFLLPAVGSSGKKDAKIELDELRQVLSNRLARLVDAEQVSVSAQRSQKLGLSTTSEEAAAEEEWEVVSVQTRKPLKKTHVHWVRCIKCGFNFFTVSLMILTLLICQWEKNLQQLFYM